MDQPPQLRQPLPMDGTPKKNNCLFGCLGLVIGVPILLVIIGYYVLMHTAVPLRFAAKVIDQDKQIQIQGIGGSISKGFTIDNFRYTDDSGNESVLEGLALQWADINRMRKNQELVIEQIALRRAHIYIQSNDGSAKTPSGSSSTGPVTGSGSGNKLNLLEIKNVDIREVVVESTNGDFKLVLDETLMKGFRIKGDQFDLASLSVGSNFLDLHLEDAETVTIGSEQIPFKRRIVGVIKPEMHKSLTQKIDFTVELGAVAGKMVARFRGFNGAVEAINLGPLGYESMSFKNFSPADYFSPENSGPVSKLTMELRTGVEAEKTGLKTAQLESGNFTLGTTLFTMAPQILKKDPSTSTRLSESIVATSQLDGLEITATLKEAEEPPLYRVALSSKPPRDPRDLIALIWFGKAYSDLTPEQAAAADATEKRDFPPEK